MRSGRKIDARGGTHGLQRWAAWSGLLLGLALLLLLGWDLADAAPSATVVVSNPAFAPLAIDRSGTAWGTPSSAPTELWRSSDEGATWTKVTGWSAIGRRPWYVTPLSSGTLLIAYDTGSHWTIARSDDQGQTWTRVLALPCMASDCTTRYTTLGAGSLAEGGGDVFLGTYNNAPGTPWPNSIYRSSDDGRTWAVTNTTTTHRHIHSLTWDPVRNRLYVFFGDSDGDGVWYSDDRGVTLQSLCTIYRCVAVRAIDDEANGSFLVFGTDNPSTTNRIMKVNTSTGASTELASLAYPSYSALRAGSVWLVGETHESGLPLVDPKVHVYGSDDDGGASWTSVYETTIPSTSSVYRMDVVGAFPNGDVALGVPGQGTVVLRFGAAPPPPPPAPASSSPPVVSGTAQVGQTLTTTNGTWTNAPTGYTYRWRRCDTSGADCSDIPGATSSSYTLAQPDLGARVRARVSATNAGGTTSADSDPSATVTAQPSPPPPPPPPSPPSSPPLSSPAPPHSGPAAPLVDALPAISGAPRVGRLLTATSGAWSNAPTTFAYQWRRCSSGAACRDIGGATAPSYRVAAADLGSSLRVRVTAANRAGAAHAESMSTAIVTKANLVRDANVERGPAGAFVTAGSATFRWVDDRAHSPRRSLRISSTAAGVSRWVTVPIRARGAARYTAAVWVETSGLRSRVELALTFWSASGAPLGRATSPTGASGGWRRVAVARVAPQRTAFVRVELRQRGPGSSWWDDVSLTTP